MKLILSIIMALALVPAWAQGLRQQYKRVLTDPETYVCYRTTEKMNIDGKLNEGAWKKAASTCEFVDISGEGFAKPKFKTTAKMLWDDEYLYVGAELEEPNITAYLTQRDTIIYYDNDFEVFINTTNNGVNYFEIETNARGVVFDLMLDKSYRSEGNFIWQWDCPGLKLKTNLNGTLNKSSDTDKGWTVEMAIPWKAVAVSFDHPLKAGNVWRINFSRVEWLKGGKNVPGNEENWVWSPTGEINMHMPDRWGYLLFSDNVVGKGVTEFKYPYNKEIYKLLWAMFYAEKDYFSKNASFMRLVESFGITDADRVGIPADAKISVEATDNLFRIEITDPANNHRYVVDHDGHFQLLPIVKSDN